MATWKATFTSIEKSITPELIDITVHYTDGVSNMDQVLTVAEGMDQQTIGFLVSRRVATLEALVAVEQDLSPLLTTVIEGVAEPKVLKQ